MRTNLAVWVVVMAAAVPVVARADDGLLKKVTAEKDNPSKAGALLGDAAAKAHRTGDLVAEWEASEVLRSVHSPGRSGEPDPLLLTIRGKINANRCGAFFSVPVLSGDLLLAAVASGDSDLVESLAADLKLHIRGGKSGKAIGMRAVETRLKGASDPVLAPWKSALEYRSAQGGAGAAGAPGGAGGAGKDAGSGDLAPVGEALKKMKSGSALATVQRTEKGFEFRVAWNPRFVGTHERHDGTRYLDDGGLTIGFADWAVAVAMVDPTGLDGQPGAGGGLQSGLAWYRLARGETLSVSKEGVVTFAQAR